MADHSLLTNLPTEVLWRIAACGPAESALSMTAVCRRLRNALLDALVFRSIIDYQKDSPGQDLGLDVDAIAPLLGDDTQAWARLAVADSKARAIRWASTKDSNDLGLSDEETTFLRNLDRYAPSLLSLKYQAVLSSEATNILLRPFWVAYCKTPRYRSVGSRKSYDDAIELMSPGLSFYLCATTLSFLDTFPGYSEGVFASKLIRACVCAVQQDDFEGREHFEHAFTPTLAHVSLCSWASLLSSHIEMLGDANEPSIPKPSKIPWPTKAAQDRLPLPFFDSMPTSGSNKTSGSIVTWEEWYTDCTTSMTDPTFLTEGEWCGYWSFDSYAFGSPSVSFAESIERMVLVVPPLRRSSRYGRTPQPIIATYPDSFHDFVLEGHIYQDGIFELGPPGDSWVWRGRMTPFGMFGYWGSSDWSRIAGACWLWKRSWCNPRRTDTTAATA